VEASTWAKALGLKEHPEGGYFKEIYRAEMVVEAPGFKGQRSVCSAIYYLLKSGQFSTFHRIKSDELWHFYAGSPLAIHIIDSKDGLYHKKVISRTGGPNHPALQAVVKGGCWFAAAVERPRSYSLVGCTVSPGFDFQDWEIGERRKLLALYPQHSHIIDKLTRK